MGVGKINYTVVCVNRSANGFYAVNFSLSREILLSLWRRQAAETVTTTPFCILRPGQPSDSDFFIAIVKPLVSKGYAIFILLLNFLCGEWREGGLLTKST